MIKLTGKARFYPCILAVVMAVQSTAFSAVAQTGPVEDTVLTAKLFPLIRGMQQSPALEKQVGKEPALRKLMQAQQLRGGQALAHCSTVACMAGSIKWTREEIAAAGNAMIHLLTHKKEGRKAVARLRKQAAYPLYDSLPDSSYIRRAWLDAAQGINRIVDVYINGQRPQYGAIDSISFGRGDTAFYSQLRKTLQQVQTQRGKRTCYDDPLQLALAVLHLNGRDEAARYEPLAGGENQGPVQKIKQTDFSKYKYSVILIPGQGPEQEGLALHPNGAARCRMGVERYRAGLAPFIVVSGGNVHPFRTPYNEAVEMKKYMVEQLGVPADVIFIEPHARHTTTNLRNTARMIYRFGIPAGKPVLVVTDASQSSYIVQRMDKVLLRDLGYVPYTGLQKLSAEETLFYPALKALQPNPADPLDP